jgi:hypothetical protein
MRAALGVTSTVGVILLASTAAAGPAGAEGHEDADHEVVVEGLNNPRGLGWDGDDTLLIAEAGRGGEDCTGVPCVGTTGAIATADADERDQEPERIATGFLSIAETPIGAFAVGVNDVDATDTDGELIATGYDPEKPPTEGGALLVTFVDPDGERVNFAYADLYAAEKDQNPDGAQIDSNPYGILFVDEDPDSSPDGYALVADAGANTVWKVEPDFDAAGQGGPAPYTVEPFVTYPADPDEEAPEIEFVPTSLATDGDGDIYVGGLGSLVPGGGSVVEYTADGSKEIHRWDGFTAVHGIAVDRRHLYVSQLFGEVGFPQGPSDDGVPGQVVRLSRHTDDGPRRAVDIPLPAGLAVDDGDVYAAVNSLAPADGIPAGPENPVGEVGGGAVWEIDFEGAYPVDPIEPPDPADLPPGPE